MKRAVLLLTALVMLGAAMPAQALDKPRDWEPPPPESVPNHRKVYREVIAALATYAHQRNSSFLVLVRNAVELVVKGDREEEWDQIQDPDGRNFEKRHPLGTPYRGYVNTIDGLVLDDLYCGPNAFGKPLDQAIKERRAFDRQLAEEKANGVQRPPVPQPLGPFSIDPEEEIRRAKEVRRQVEKVERQRRILYAADTMRQNGRVLLSLNECKNAKDAQQAYQDGARDRVLSYAHTGDEELSRIPKGHPWGENADPVGNIKQARNWLPLLRADAFGSKADWVDGLANTNQDVLLVDVAYRGIDGLAFADINRLHFKKLGSRRLVLAVLSLGRAYDWRWYWKRDWRVGAPPFLFAPDSDQPGAYITDLQDAMWREELGKAITSIINVGFDGVVLDDADTYLWFEDLMPLK